MTPERLKELRERENEMTLDYEKPLRDLNNLKEKYMQECQPSRESAKRVLEEEIKRLTERRDLLVDLSLSINWGALSPNAERALYNMIKTSCSKYLP